MLPNLNLRIMNFEAGISIIPDDENGQAGYQEHKWDMIVRLHLSMLPLQRQEYVVTNGFHLLNFAEN